MKDTEENEETRKKYRDFNVTEEDFAYYRYLDLLQSAEAARTVSGSLKQQKKILRQMNRARNIET